MDGILTPLFSPWRMNGCGTPGACSNRCGMETLEGSSWSCIDASVTLFVLIGGVPVRRLDMDSANRLLVDGKLASEDSADLTPVARRWREADISNPTGFVGMNADNGLGFCSIGKVR